jgi:glycosyltransferase involved in cell wall biosynthesis
MADPNMAGDEKAGRVPASRVSALVVVHNEERQLGACLACLAFADEIVVVLDRCTDRSKEIAEAAGAVLLEGAWEREGGRRNTGIAACSGDWILEVDADERVPDAVAREIRGRLAEAPPGYFLVGFDNHIGSRCIRYGWGAYNGVARKPCLFAKGCKSWGGERVHPRVELKGARGELAARIQHFVDRDIADMMARLNRYSSLAALDAADAGERPRIARALRRVFSRFWKAYVARRGYREGPYGLALGLFSALYPILTQLKLATLHDQ